MSLLIIAGVRLSANASSAVRIWLATWLAAAGYATHRVTARRMNHDREILFILRKVLLVVLCPSIRQLLYPLRTGRQRSSTSLSTTRFFAPLRMTYCILWIFAAHSRSSLFALDNYFIYLCVTSQKNLSPTSLRGCSLSRRGGGSAGCARGSWERPRQPPSSLRPLSCIPNNWGIP